MTQSGIDQEALVKMFSEATAKQGDTLRQAVSTATVQALRGRDLTLENIRKVLKTITQAASTGAAQNTGSVTDLETLLSKAFSGMDAALLQAVEAHRKALKQFVDQGVGLKEPPLQVALANVEKMEDVLFATVTKATQALSGPVQGMWDHVLKAMKLQGTDTGARATFTSEQLLAQTHTALRDGRAAGVRTMQAMMDGYTALVSGVLIGMSEGLQPRSETKPDSK